jgi:hypothetical protein
MRLLRRSAVGIFLLAACALTGCSQARTHAEAQAVVPPTLTYIGQWGMKGDGPGQLEQPVSIAADALGNVFVVDAASLYISKFDGKGTPLLSFQDDNVKHPQSIAVDSGGAIYVTDSGRGSVMIFLPGGDRYRELKLKVHPHEEDALDVTVEGGGDVHFLDPDANTIYSYSAPTFRLMKTWKPAASGPNFDVRAKSIAAAADGFLYVADTPGNRIVKFSDDGHFAGEIDGGDRSERKLSSEFALSGNDVFAMDADGRTVHVWSLAGQLILDADLTPELGQANRSVPALAISPRKELLVLDMAGARVFRYKISF